MERLSAPVIIWYHAHEMLSVRLSPPPNMSPRFGHFNASFCMLWETFKKISKASFALFVVLLCLCRPNRWNEEGWVASPRPSCRTSFTRSFPVLLIVPDVANAVTLSLEEIKTLMRTPLQIAGYLWLSIFLAEIGVPLNYSGKEVDVSRFWRFKPWVGSIQIWSHFLHIYLFVGDLRKCSVKKRIACRLTRFST